MTTHARKQKIKLKAFERDGFRDKDGRWFAMCGFGCGEVLSWKTATLDRWPVKGEHGGEYEIDNIRLACRECNCLCRNKKDGLTRKQRAREQRKRDWERHLEKIENRKAHEENRIRSIESISFRPVAYPEKIKKKLSENYPRSEGRDRNGVVIYDVARKKFRYET